MFVKICGLSNEEHLQVAVDAGADAVGFVFADSVRQIDPKCAAEIANKVPDTVKKVAVMLHPSNDAWQEVLREFSPDVLQTDAEDFDSLDVPEEVDCWPVYRENNRVTVPLLRVTVPFVYEGARSGSGEAVDWAAAAEVAKAVT